MANIELLNKVMNHIELHPNQHDQTVWAERTVCGTAMCFAGWAVVLSGGKIAFAGNSTRTSQCRIDGAMDDIDLVAERLLGLSMDDANDLFGPTNTIEDLREIVDMLIERDRS